jgi:hypothetical protein
MINLYNHIKIGTETKQIYTGKRYYTNNHIPLLRHNHPWLEGGRKNGEKD